MKTYLLIICYTCKYIHHTYQFFIQVALENAFKFTYKFEHEGPNRRLLSIDICNR